MTWSVEGVHVFVCPKMTLVDSRRSAADFSRRSASGTLSIASVGNTAALRGPPSTDRLEAEAEFPGNVDLRHPRRVPFEEPASAPLGKWLSAS